MDADEPAMDGTTHGRRKLERRNTPLLTLLASFCFCAEAATARGDDAAQTSDMNRSAISANESRPLGVDSGWLQLGESGMANSEQARESASDQPSFNSSGLAPDELFRMIGPLAAVLAAIGAIAFVARRFAGRRAGFGSQSNLIEILQTFPIARGHAVILLRLERRVLLLHKSGQVMTTLCEISDAEEAGALLARIEEHSRPTFAHRLARALHHPSSGADNPFQYIETVDLTRGRDPSRSAAWLKGDSR
jgi:flagellar biogenesis protein FliO